MTEVSNIAQPTDREQIKQLQRELSDHRFVEKILVAAGIVSEEKLSQAHAIVREFNTTIV